MVGGGGRKKVFYLLTLCECCLSCRTECNLLSYISLYLKGLLGNMVLPDTNVKIGNFRLPTIKDTFNSGKQSFNFPTEGDIFNPGIQETIFNSGIQQDIFNTSNAGNIFNSVVDILKSVTSTDLLKTLTSLLSQLNLGMLLLVLYNPL